MNELTVRDRVLELVADWSKKLHMEAIKAEGERDIVYMKAYSYALGQLMEDIEQI